MRFRSLIVAVLLACVNLYGAEPPEDFFATYNQLSIIVDDDDPGPMEMAKGSYLASVFFSVGEPGLPKAQSWFSAAHTRGRASMSGLFLAIHGHQEHLDAVQRELETNRTKRGWLYELVGSMDNFNIAMENGRMWKPFLRVLPSTTGCQKLSLSCMKSKDVLVRRTGLYWGYWFATPQYWAAARNMADEDADKLARDMAQRLIHVEKSGSG